MDEKDLEVGIDLEDSDTEEFSMGAAVSHNYNYSYTDIFELEDIDERRFYINADIDEDILNTIGYHILRCNRLDKGIPIEERKPIVLYINSLGGDVYSGYSLIDIIKSSMTPVYTVNEGICMSMAFLISLAGVKRYSFKHSVYLMHEGYGGGSNSMSKLKEQIEFETGQMETETKKYVLENTKMSDDIYNSKYRSEWYMYPDEAKKYGIVDYIVGVDCTIDDIN